MPKVKIKKKVVRKKKQILKTKVKIKGKILHAKKRKVKNTSPDIIFDSSIGKTDALFVSEPELGAAPVVQLDNPPEKKSWWQKIFGK